MGTGGQGRGRGQGEGRKGAEGEMGSGRRQLLKKNSLSLRGLKKTLLGFRIARKAPTRATVRGTGAAAVRSLKPLARAS